MGKFLEILLWVISFLILSESKINLAMYKMENYDLCQKSGNLYCVFHFVLKGNSSGIIVDGISVDNKNTHLFNFDRSYLGRMICVPKNETPQNFGLETFKNELKDFKSLIVTTKSIYCQNDNKNAGNYLYTMAVCSVLISYFLFSIYTTKLDSNSLIEKSNTAFQWVQAFSLKRNFQKLYANNLNKDFQRLKSIQGIRVINTAIIIKIHTILVLSQLFLRDVNQMEENRKNKLVLCVLSLGTFTVQFYFLTSSFLLTNQIYSIYKNHGLFTLKFCGILLINRICRLIPSIIVNIAITFSVDIFFQNSPHHIKLFAYDFSNWKKNWLYTILQISFLLPFGKICIPGFWYTSVDTLYYTIALILLYFILKFNYNLVKFIGILILASIIIFASYIHINNYSPFMQFNPEVFKYLLDSAVMDQIYVNPIASWTSSLIGICLGYYYFISKNEKINFTRNSVILWWIIVAGAPIYPLYLSTLTLKNGLLASFIGGILKPFFVLSTGILFTGMAFGLGGIVKTMLESKILLCLSNITYCTYLYHFLIIFIKGLFTKTLIDYRTSHLYFWATFDIFCGFTLGAFFTVFIEQPFLCLQKFYLPQIKKQKNL